MDGTLLRILEACNTNGYTAKYGDGAYSSKSSGRSLFGLGIKTDSFPSRALGQRSTTNVHLRMIALANSAAYASYLSINLFDATS